MRSTCTVCRPRGRIGELGRQNSGRGVLAPDRVDDAVHQVSAQQRRVFPPLAEHSLKVADGRPAHRELHVVPGRAGAVHRRHGLALNVPVVVGPIAPAVAQVDSADERDVESRSPGVAEHDQNF